MNLLENPSYSVHRLLTPALLQQNIIDLTQGPSLFHRYLEVLKQDASLEPPLFNQLVPPQALCDSAKKLRDYNNVALTPKDPLFSRMHKLIDLLQIAVFSSEKGKDASQKIIAMYRSYVSPQKVVAGAHGFD